MKANINLLDDTSKLDRATPIPLYFQLKNIILEKIQDESFKEGDIIPTEAEFQEFYNISRSTIRQAIAELVQEGWLDRKTSKGTFVTYPNKKISHIHSFEPFYQQVKQLGKTPSTELIHLSIIQCSQELTVPMGLSQNDKVISMYRRRFADEEPLVTIHNFLPYKFCSFILDHDFRTESLYEILTINGVTKIDRTKTIVSAKIASKEDSQLLRIGVGDPILCFNTISTNASGTVIDFAYSHYRGDRNRFEIDVKPEK